MSEFINFRDSRATIRWKLLTSASALALTAYVSSASMARAEDADHPQVWIKIGGQLEQQTSQSEIYLPPFVVNNPDSLAFKPVSPLNAEKTPLFATGLEGQIAFEPDGSDWVFSAAIRYGRSVKHKNPSQRHYVTSTHQHTQFLFAHTPSGAATGPLYSKTSQIKDVQTEFAQDKVAQKQSHTIIDFAAGKDVGIGLFGNRGSSTISAGVRIAQFTSKSSSEIHARPDSHVLVSCNSYLYSYFHTQFPKAKFCKYGHAHHSYAAEFQDQREFQGIGPTVSWNASVPIWREQSDTSLNLDWGVNAALLFGKQRARGNHQTSGYYWVVSASGVPRTHYTTSGNFHRSRKVVIPNLGGFAGLSFQYADAKVSFGYRGDFFFNAMDAGNDARKTKTVGFFGPFASLSIGIGD